MLLQRCKPCGGRQGSAEHPAEGPGCLLCNCATHPRLVREAAAENGPARVTGQGKPVGLGEGGPVAHHPWGWRGEEFPIP